MRRRLALGTSLLIALLAQTAFFPYVRFLGVVPDVMLLTVVAVAAREGPEAGALFGFVAGMVVDLFFEGPAGLSALAYTIVGYGVGVAQTGLLRSQWWLSPLLGGVGSLAGGLVYVLVGIVVGQDYLLAARTFVVLAERAAYDAVLALLVFPLVNRLLGRAQPARTYR